MYIPRKWFVVEDDNFDDDIIGIQFNSKDYYLKQYNRPTQLEENQRLNEAQEAAKLLSLLDFKPKLKAKLLDEIKKNNY